MKNKVRKWFLEKLLRSITTLLISKSELESLFKKIINESKDPALSKSLQQHARKFVEMDGDDYGTRVSNLVTEMLQ
jgi:hypothetical protein